MYQINTGRLLSEMSLKEVYIPENREKIYISGVEINRPGLQLTGFYKHFVPGRIQVVGDQEIEYLETLTEKERRKRIENLFIYPIPAFIVAHKMKVFPEMIEFAKKYKRLLLTTEIATSRFIRKIIDYLEVILAPKVTMHGVLVEVFGMGVLLKGKSGVGKSETALELIKRGHRLVADDAVEIKEIDGSLQGTSLKSIRHFMEIRGIGILDIKRLYGFGAVKNWELLDLVIELEDWVKDKEYERLGIDDNMVDILGVNVPIVTVPVRPGRNIAMIIEVAVRNTRQKQFGYNAAEELDRRIRADIMERKGE